MKVSRKKITTYLEIADEMSGNKLKYKNLTPKQARDKLNEFLENMEGGL